MDTKNKIAILCATWLGSGYLKPASGTWGTLAAFPLALICTLYGSLGTIALVSVLLFILGLWSAHIYEMVTERHDCKHVVIDEACGIMIAATPILIDPSYWVIIGSFVLFRLFDALKIGLVGWCDKNIHGSFGVMIDDVVAGFLTAITLMGVLLWIQ